MTATYQIPTSHAARVRFRSKPVDPSKIHVIIPTFDDWEGLRVTLDGLHRLTPRPLKITVVNDNYDKNEPNWVHGYGAVMAPAYYGNYGPAFARNIGFGFPPTLEDHPLRSTGPNSRYKRLPRREWREDSRLDYNRSDPSEFRWKHDIDWFYFTDCGCEPPADLFLRFENAWTDTGDSCVAISGPVIGSEAGTINRFMTEQGVLNPPRERLIYDTLVPQAIVTANALVCGMAFSFVGGFDEMFTEAAGEDLDLGIRLRQLGIIGWAEGAKVKHRFKEEHSDFIQRFRRYGSGTRRLELKHNLPSLRPRRYKAEKPDLQELADLQVKAMQDGYDEAVEPTMRGRIILS